MFNDETAILRYRTSEKDNHPRILQVREYHKGDKLVNKAGYVRPDGTVYMYVDVFNPDEYINAYIIPIAYRDKRDPDRLVFRDASDPFIKNQFRKENIVRSSFKKISESITDEPIYTEEEEIGISGSGKIFIPSIGTTDDFLKKIVKAILQKKQLDLKILQKKVNTKYTLTNMKAALIKETKMTTGNYVPWMNLLGTRFVMEIYDEDPQHPVGNPIGTVVYDFVTDTITFDDGSKIEPPVIGDTMTCNAPTTPKESD